MEQFSTCSQQIIFERFRKGNGGKKALGLNLPRASLCLYQRFLLGFFWVFLWEVTIGKCLQTYSLRRAALLVWTEVVCHWCLPPWQGLRGCGPRGAGVACAVHCLLRYGPTCHTSVCTTVHGGACMRGTLYTASLQRFHHVSHRIRKGWAASAAAAGS